MTRLNPSGRIRASSWLPWVFVLGVAAGTFLPAEGWWKRLVPFSPAPRTYNDTEWNAAWRRAEGLSSRHKIEVLQTLDGDTFVARVNLWPGLEMTTRVRLRGIDAPEMSAQCVRERQLAEDATRALRDLLRQGDVAIYDIGPDKYAGRVVANVATRTTPSVSAALQTAGHARAYKGGRREGWC